MSERAELHVIEAPGYSVVFHPPTYALLKVGRKAGRVLREFSDGSPVEEIAGRHCLRQTDIVQLVEQVENHLRKQDTVNPDPAFVPKEHAGILKKLELMITNDCNMNCAYCYAQGGNYGRPAALMSQETARLAVDRMFEHYTDIESVVFFGGEPLMNLPAIESVCELFEQKLTTGKISTLPVFGIVTNGTLISGRAADMVKRYGIRVTVSIDGPKEINDTIRQFKGGCGTYDAIKRGVGMLRTRGIAPDYEATFTQYHHEQGCSPIAVLEHLHTELGFGVGRGAVGDAMVDDEDPLNLKDPVKALYEPMLDWSVREFIDGKLLAGNMLITTALQVLSKQPRSHICPAGYTSLAVTSTGDVYPCHILTDRDEFIIGNIYEQNWISTDRAKAVFSMLHYASKEHNPYCKECWARHICTGCLGLWGPTGRDQYFVRQANCSVKQAIWDRILLKLVALRDDEAGWQKFVTTLRRISQQAGQNEVAGIDSSAGEPPRSIGETFSRCR